GLLVSFFFFFSSRRRHTRSKRDWSSDVCSSDLHGFARTSFTSHDSKAWIKFNCGFLDDAQRVDRQMLYHLGVPRFVIVVIRRWFGRKLDYLLFICLRDHRDRRGHRWHDPRPRGHVMGFHYAYPVRICKRLMPIFLVTTGLLTIFHCRAILFWDTAAPTVRGQIKFSHQTFRKWC